MLVAFRCNANTNLIHNWTYTVNSWTNPWEFTGFALGPSSGDYYNLLSTTVQSE